MLQAGPAPIQQLDANPAPFLDQREPTIRPVLEELCARGWATNLGWNDPGDGPGRARPGR